jgi:hypothetical protein
VIAVWGGPSASGIQTCRGRWITGLSVGQVMSACKAEVDALGLDAMIAKESEGAARAGRARWIFVPMAILASMFPLVTFVGS